MLKASLIFASLAVSPVLGVWSGDEGESVLENKADGVEGNVQGEEKVDQQQNTFNKIAYSLSSGYMRTF